eukprot:TRINITY_DN7794_c1_g2_i4.p1 TRINITY_DN7794_c1_g2~~TRINITY_DN7794_c1_g2_i4.p1  ORF type:complete len:252 (-),score=6.30 TRINITY_DN7794_c1_g2_i4:172-927(-)
MITNQKKATNQLISKRFEVNQQLTYKHNFFGTQNQTLETRKKTINQIFFLIVFDQLINYLIKLLHPYSCENQFFFLNLNFQVNLFFLNHLYWEIQIYIFQLQKKQKQERTFKLRSLQNNDDHIFTNKQINLELKMILYTQRYKHNFFPDVPLQKYIQSIFVMFVWVKDQQKRYLKKPYQPPTQKKYVIYTYIQQIKKKTQKQRQCYTNFQNPKPRARNFQPTKYPKKPIFQVLFYLNLYLLQILQKIIHKN